MKRLRREQSRQWRITEPRARRASSRPTAISHPTFASYDRSRSGASVQPTVFSVTPRRTRSRRSDPYRRRPVHVDCQVGSSPGLLGSGTREATFESLGEVDWNGRRVIGRSMRGGAQAYFDSERRIVGSAHGSKPIQTYHPHEALYDWRLKPERPRYAFCDTPSATQPGTELGNVNHISHIVRHSHACANGLQRNG
jgi:hypothetical protein